MASIIYHGLNYFSLIFLALIFFGNINNITSHYANSDLSINAKDSTSDKILCRICGADLADSKDIINHLSPLAAEISNQTIFERDGVEIQLLATSHVQFYSITLLDSKCASNLRHRQKNYNWYPGYVGTPCICSQCGSQVGWNFKQTEPTDRYPHFESENKFSVLKVYNLLSENFANSLIVTPKSLIN